MAQLALTSLALSHFRSHKRVSLLCDTRPVTLVGNNGAGKTNILEAVSLFAPGRGIRRASAEDMTRRPEAIGWSIKGTVSSPDRSREIQMKSEQGSARKMWIDGKAEPQIALGRFSRVLWLIPSMDRLWIEGAEGRRRFLDRMTLSLFPDHAEASISYDKAMRERNRLLKDQVRDPAWYEALEVQMAMHGCRIMAARREAVARILGAQFQAETAFPAADLELHHPESEPPRDPEGLRQALAGNRPRDLMAGRSLLGPHRSDLIARYESKGIAARDASTGEQKALLISLILANARAIQADFGTAPLILLDEVAAHLDENRRSALYDEICGLNAQAWMTGTEINLFHDLGDRAQVFEVTETPEGSQVCPTRFS